MGYLIYDFDPDQPYWVQRNAKWSAALGDSWLIAAAMGIDLVHGEVPKDRQGSPRPDWPRVTRHWCEPRRRFDPQSEAALWWIAQPDEQVMQALAGQLHHDRVVSSLAGFTRDPGGAT